MTVKQLITELGKIENKELTLTVDGYLDIRELKIKISEVELRTRRFK